MKSIIKAILVVSMFIGFTNAALAQTAKQIEICEVYGQLAEVIMSERMKDKPMSQMLRTADGDQTAIRLVTQAYSHTNMHDKEHARKMVRMFKDQTMVSCLKSAQNKSR